MKKIPYGISDFETLMKDGYCYYVDKTPYIEKLESLGSRYHFFLRPRRFGKSLLLSSLCYYYDINSKDKFEKLFGDTYIGKNPTPMCNSLPILRLDFSGMQTHLSDEKIESSFDMIVRGSVDSFLFRYQDNFNFSKDISEKILSRTSAGDIINQFIICMNNLDVSYYLFIDEYDNFANNILIHSGEEKYRRITHQSGFLRSFFAAIKKGTSTGTVEKLFVTGVSPLVLADVTSGMNIGDNISFNPEFNAMAGFSEAEVEAMLDYYISEGVVPKAERNNVLNTMRRHYNNYVFCEDMSARVYNSDMVLYFFNKYLSMKKFPSDLIDTNIRTDYGKLRYLLLKNNELNGNFNILKEIVVNGEIDTELFHSFAMDDIIEHDKFKSFLYYLGLMTIKESIYGNKFVLEIPNEVVRTLHHEYIRRSVEEFYKLKINTSFLSSEFDKMAFKGEWMPAISYVLEKLYETASLRDFVDRESGVKMFLLAYLGLSPLYISESEPEMNKGYADIFLRKDFAITDKTAYEYLIELKHVKADDLDSDGKLSDEKLNKLKEQASKQLEQYGKSKEISCPIKKIVIICCARSVLLLEEL